MKIVQLDNTNQVAPSGFTHKAVISAAQGDFAAAAGTQTYTLAVLGVGDVVGRVATRLVTPVSGGAISAATVVAGKTGTTNAYLTSTDVFTGSTALAKVGDLSTAEAHVAASALIVTLATTGANVSVATAGEIEVFFNLINLAKL